MWGSFAHQAVDPRGYPTDTHWSLAMPRPGRKSRMLPIALLSACSMFSPRVIMADPPKTLVVVTDGSDVECVRRIGDKLVEVEVLLIKEGLPQRTDYAGCNDRVKRFSKFRYLLYREETEGSAERFWRQRLVAANPNGATHRLSSTRLNTGIELQAERAKVIHEALSETFPGHRQQLDANLNAELLRLYSLTGSPLQFASLAE